MPAAPATEGPEMAITRSKKYPGEAAAAGAAGPVARRPAARWRRIRIALLSLATAVLLAGAVAAGLFGYLSIGRG
jgi:hypothetical protein